MSYKKLRGKGSIGPFLTDETYSLGAPRAEDPFMSRSRPIWQDGKFARIRQWRSPNKYKYVDDFPLRQSRAESDVGMFVFRDLSVRYTVLIDRERHQTQMLNRGDLDAP